MKKYDPTVVEVDSSCSLNRLPDEIILEILNKIIDLKTLSLCKLVSRRFNRIVHQVDVISFSAPCVDVSSLAPKTSECSFLRNIFRIFISKPFHLLRSIVVVPCEPRYRHSLFHSAIKSMERFTNLKSLCIEVSSSLEGVDNGCLFKWKIKFGNKLDYFVYLSPDSIIDILHVNNGQEVEVEDEEDIELRVDKKIDNAITECRKDASVRFMMFCECVSSFPLMETVSITDSDKRGKISVSGGKINELRKWLHSPSQTIDQMMIRSTHGPHRISGCYFPLLELPVSGYVMKRVTLVLAERADLTDDERNRFINIDDEEDYIEDKEEAAFSEALMEILENRRDEMETIAVL